MNTEDYKYGKYMSTSQETRWATIDEIKNRSVRINLADDDYPGAGLPLMSDSREAYVDNLDTHTIIFGATGSKKTRLFCMPMINIFAKAGESFVATDPKGELYAKTSGLVKSKGYKIVVLNLRDIGKGDRWNPLALPYDLYHSGNKETATSIVNDFINTLAAPQFKSTNDVFWPQMASALAFANACILLDCAKKEECNMASFSKMCSGGAIPDLERLSPLLGDETLVGLNYSSVLSNPDKTRSCIFSSLFSMVSLFNTQKNLTNMLSNNTFDIRDFGREKTAVYVIVPDEKSTYHFLVTTFVKQVYEVLIAEAQKEKNFVLQRRVNFVLDEFCNIPKIPDMAPMISAARSRNMRFFLIAQSKHQLIGKYGEDAETIKGNCDNWVFLTSKELDLLREISELCGTLNISDIHSRRLISVSELQRLDKEKGEALIMNARQYPIITELADIDSYEMFKGFDAVPFESFESGRVELFSVKDLIRKLLNKEIPVPMSEPNESQEEPQGPEDELKKRIRKILNDDLNS